MNVKKGDMALIIRSETGANAGRIVTVLEYVGRVMWPMCEYENVWRVEFQNPAETFLQGSDGNFYPHITKLAVVPDAWMIPINPPEKDQDTDITAPSDCEVLTT